MKGFEAPFIAGLRASEVYPVIELVLKLHEKLRKRRSIANARSVHRRVQLRLLR